MKVHFHLVPKLGMFIILAFLHSIFASAQWSVPVSISPNSRNAQMTENMGPCMAVSGDTLHVIWSDLTTRGSAIYYTRSVDTGHTWSPPVNITDTNGKAFHPSLAVNGSNIHVVWWDSLNQAGYAGFAGNSSFYKHSLDDGNTWSAPLAIDSHTIYWPGVAVSGSTVLVSINAGVSDSTIVLMTKSTDNGATFGAEQKVSTRIGYGRAEDQGIATDGRYIHMCWNDYRNLSVSQRVLKTYYRRSQDMGVTWDPEVDITDTIAYSPMVFIDSDKINLAMGYSGNSGNSITNSWMAQSADTGSTWGPVRQVTTNNTAGKAEAYPFMVCDGSNLYMVSEVFPVAPWQIFFTQSTDGGVTWSPQIALGTCNGSAFIALTCPVLHAVWPDSGRIYYTRNPTGSSTCSSAACIPTSSTTSLSICSSALPYSWNGLTFIADGSQTAHLTNRAGCDSAATLSLTVRATSTSTTSLSICPSALPYSWNGLTFIAGGSQTAHLTNRVGCDSAATLSLTVKTNPAHTVRDTISNGQAYTIGADTFTVSGTYMVDLTGAAADGCDSLVTLNLTVNGGGTGGNCVPSVSISASSTSPCTSVTFTAVPTNGGVSPSYEWYRNNIPEGTNSASYTVSSLNYDDSVWVQISAIPCGTLRRTALSNKIKITGTSGNTPSVSISANNTNLNIGGPITVTATPLNAGTNPAYAWYHNGARIGSVTQPVLTYGGTLGNGDQIYCILTSTSCGGAQHTTSNVITFTKSGSSERNITEFIMPDQIGTSVIDTNLATVTAVVTLLPAQRTAIHPVHILVSTGATYSPSEANIENFSLPVTYTVTAQDGSSRVWTVTVVDAAGQRLDANSSGTDEPAIAGLTLYPNPASTYITALMQGGTDPAVVTILDMSGRVMYNQQLPASGTINHQVDVSVYASGAYIINIQVGDYSETKQFIVTRQ